MGKKKDCFGQEDYVCMTPSCPYAADCIKAVWEKRMERVMSRGAGGGPAPKKRRSRSRLTVEG